MENIISKIKYISRNMMLGHSQVMKKFDIKKIGFGKLPILQMIVECPGIHADDIAKTLELDKATIALSLKKLISLGLIVKKQDEHDKRKKKLFPTKRMIGISNEVKTYTDDNIKKLLDGFTDSDIEALDGYLLRIKNNLNKYKNLQGEQNG